MDRELVSLVGKKGWDELTVVQRGGLSDPAPASEAYKTSLARLYAFKQSMKPGQAHGDAPEPDDAALAEIGASEAFNHFVDAQLTWDRAMAEAIADAYRRDPEALVVGIVGRGHLEYGHGIPHQLADMGITDVAVALPVGAAEACAMEPDLATAVFVLGEPTEDAEASGKPRLGVFIEAAETGVQVMDVVAGSVAEKSGIRSGDVIVSAAGFTTTTPAELIEVVSRQAPGTWLPLLIQRDDKERDVVAKFPQRFDPAP